jgi:hypothetical protein
LVDAEDAEIWDLHGGDMESAIALNVTLCRQKLMDDFEERILSMFRVEEQAECVYLKFEDGERRSSETSITTTRLHGITS